MWLRSFRSATRLSRFNHFIILRRNLSTIRFHENSLQNPYLHSTGSVTVRGETVPLPPNPIIGVSSPKLIASWGENAVLFPPIGSPKHYEVSKSTELYLSLRSRLYKLMEGVWVLSHYQYGLSFFNDEYSAHVFAERIGIGNESVCYCLGREINEIVRIRGSAIHNEKNNTIDDNEITTTATTSFRINEVETEFNQNVVIDTGTSHMVLSLPRGDLSALGITTTTSTQSVLHGITTNKAKVALVNFGGIKTLTKCVLCNDDDYPYSVLGMTVLSRLKWSFDGSRDPEFTIDGIRDNVQSHLWNDTQIIADLETTIQ